MSNAYAVGLGAGILCVGWLVLGGYLSQWFLYRWRDHQMPAKRALALSTAVASFMVFALMAVLSAAIGTGWAGGLAVSTACGAAMAAAWPVIVLVRYDAQEWGGRMQRELGTRR